MKHSFVNVFPELKRIPKTSGLYYFYNGQNELLYVGRAKNLNQRILSHHKVNILHQEGLSLKKKMPKGFEHERKKWDPDLVREWSDFEFKVGGKEILVVDYVFHKVTRIEIEEMVHELAISNEREMIEKLQPPMNSETASDEYFRLQDELE